MEGAMTISYFPKFLRLAKKTASSTDQYLIFFSLPEANKTRSMIILESTDSNRDKHNDVRAKFSRAAHSARQARFGPLLG